MGKGAVEKRVKDAIQLKSGGEGDNAGMSTGMSTVMSSVMGNGVMNDFMETPVSMPEPVQAKMESAFGAGLDNVELYSSGKMQSTGLEGVASGNKISIASNKLDFQSVRGQELLGHEISHVVSQAKGETGQHTGLYHDSALERKADIEGAQAARMAMPMQAKGDVTRSSFQNIEIKDVDSGKGGIQANGFFKFLGYALEFVLTGGIASLIRVIRSIKGRGKGKSGRKENEHTKRAMDILRSSPDNPKQEAEAAKELVESLPGGENNPELLDASKEMEEEVKEERTKASIHTPPVIKSDEKPFTWERVVTENADKPPTFEILARQAKEGEKDVFTLGECGHVSVTMRYSRLDPATNLLQRYKTSFGFAGTVNGDFSAFTAEVTVPGQVTNDGNYGTNLGRSYEITNSKVNLMKRFVEEYPKGGYNLVRRNCTTFARDAMEGLGLPSSDIFEEREWDLGAAHAFLPFARTYLAPINMKNTRKQLEALGTSKEDLERFDQSRNYDAEMVGYAPGLVGEKMRHASRGRRINRKTAGDVEYDRENISAALTKNLERNLEKEKAKQGGKNTDSLEQSGENIKSIKEQIIGLNQFLDDIINVSKHMIDLKQYHDGVAGKIEKVEQECEKFLANNEIRYKFLSMSAYEMLGVCELFKERAGNMEESIKGTHLSGTKGYLNSVMRSAVTTGKDGLSAIDYEVMKKMNMEQGDYLNTKEEFSKFIQTGEKAGGSLKGINDIGSRMNVAHEKFADSADWKKNMVGIGEWVKAGDAGMLQKYEAGQSISYNHYLQAKVLNKLFHDIFPHDIAGFLVQSKMSREDITDYGNFMARFFCNHLNHCVKNIMGNKDMLEFIMAAGTVYRKEESSKDIIIEKIYLALLQLYGNSYAPMITERIMSGYFKETSEEDKKAAVEGVRILSKEEGYLLLDQESSDTLKGLKDTIAKFMRYIK